MRTKRKARLLLVSLVLELTVSCAGRSNVHQVAADPTPTPADSVSPAEREREITGLECPPDEKAVGMGPAHGYPSVGDVNPLLAVQARMRLEFPEVMVELAERKRTETEVTYDGYDDGSVVIVFKLHRSEDGRWLVDNREACASWLDKVLNDPIRGGKGT